MNPAIPLIVIFRAVSQLYTRIVIVHEMIDPTIPTLHRSDLNGNVGL